MALFEGFSKKEGSRSHTALVKSGHFSPAEEWLLDPAFLKDATLKTVWGANGMEEGVLVNYSYGGPGMEAVTIPKGRMVGVSTPVKDFVSKKLKTVMTLPGMALNANCIGMVPYNITKDYLQQARFGGNAPAVITMDYVTLPYMPTMTASTAFTAAGIKTEEEAITRDAKMPWGAVIGTVAVGDYVKATPSGRLTRFVKDTDNPLDAVGQVLAMDLNQEQWGWLKWMLWDESDIREDEAFINRSGAGNLPTDGGWPFDSKYSEGNLVYQYVHQMGLTDPTGIPGLHDGSGNFKGYGRNDNEYTHTKAAGTAAQNGVEIVEVNFTPTGERAKNIELVSVTFNGVDIPLSSSRLTVMSKDGIVLISGVTAAEVGKAVVVKYKAKHYGTHSYLDFKGVLGACNVLLRK